MGIMKLEDNEEIIGILSAIKSEENRIILIFSIIHEIELPSSGLNSDHIQDYIGKKVGLIYLNDQYRIRRIPS